MVWMAKSPITAEARAGLSHSGRSWKRFIWKAAWQARMGKVKSSTMAKSCLVLAVVPAQCHLKPSHQNVGAILKPRRVAGVRSLPPLSATNER